MRIVKVVEVLVHRIHLIVIALTVHCNLEDELIIIKDTIYNITYNRFTKKIQDLVS